MKILEKFVFCTQFESHTQIQSQNFFQNGIPSQNHASDNPEGTQRASFCGGSPDSQAIGWSGSN